ncbi:MAG: hypothetical protein R3B99_11165 [Polyangiales bacterium]
MIAGIGATLEPTRISGRSRNARQGRQVDTVERRDDMGRACTSSAGALRVALQQVVHVQLARRLRAVFGAQTAFVEAQTHQMLGMENRLSPPEGVT